MVQKTPLIDHIKILEKEPRYMHRRVLEAINIKVKGASLNRNDGLELPDAYLPLLKREESARGGQ